MTQKVTHLTPVFEYWVQDWHAWRGICVLPIGSKNFHEVSALSPIRALFLGLVEEYPESAKLSLVSVVAAIKSARRHSLPELLTRGKR